MSRRECLRCSQTGDTESFLKITGDDYLAINADGTYMNKTQSGRALSPKIQ